MTATIKHLDVIVPSNRHITIELELPPEIPEGKAAITLTINPDAPPKHRLAELFGAGKDDHLWMSDDFDAPLEDFKDYM